MSGAAPIDTVIDLSHHNGEVDFTRVRSAGVTAVIGKATQGSTYIDPNYAQNSKAATSAGLMWGAYHFGVNGDGAAQADHLLGVTGSCPETLLVLDFEPNGGREATMTLDQARAFVRRIHDRTGRWPGLYSGSLLKDALGDHRDADLAQCWLWLAQYGPIAKVPANWPVWTLWQYTQNGVVDGVTGPVDRNRFNGGAAGLRRLWGGT